jgi:hypothetical protein
MQDTTSKQPGRTARRAMFGAAMAAALVAVSPASAAVGPAGIRAGMNITTFHNIDFIGSFGHAAGDPVRVDVIRGGHRIATAAGAAIPVEGALEVNHGPEGAALPGDCWEGGTPDVRPGDLVRVHSGGGVDEAYVDDIDITGVRAVVADAAGNEGAVGGRREVWVEGTALSVVDPGAAGVPIPFGDLDSFEFLDPADNQLRMVPNEVVAGPGGEGSFRGRYYEVDGAWVTDRNRNAQGNDDIFSALQEIDGHATGFGHVEVLPALSSLLDGGTEAPGPAIGCDASPAHPSSAGALSAGDGSTPLTGLNIANMGAGVADDATVLTVGGWAAPDVTAAEVVLENGGQSLPPKPVTLADGYPAVSEGVPQKGWSATFTKAEIAGLGQGTLTARLSSGGATLSVSHDTVAPDFAATPGAGAYSGAQEVALSSLTGDPLTFSVDGGPARPYLGVPITLGPGSHTVSVRSEDAAGNVTARDLGYSIAAPAGAGSSNQPLGPGTTRAPALRATVLRRSQRISRARARRSGLTAVFRAPRGARRATVRAFRMRNGRLTRIGSKTVRARAGRMTVRLNSRAIRSRLTPGLYHLEITVRNARGRAGEPVTAFVRVRR